jgi:hypothetical protein
MKPLGSKFPGRFYFYYSVSSISLQIRHSRVMWMLLHLLARQSRCRGGDEMYQAAFTSQALGISPLSCVDARGRV